MAKTITATVAGWTGTLSLPNKVDHDAYHSVLTAIDDERQILHDDRDDELITFQEAQSKIAVLHQLAAQLLDAYRADTLPPIIWTQQPALPNMTVAVVVEPSHPDALTDHEPKPVCYTDSPDALTTIPGVGKTTARILNDHGIINYRQLAEAYQTKQLLPLPITHNALTSIGAWLTDMGYLD